MQKFVAFCAEDLGSFYLDILKDRLYTCAETSHPRRAAQSALYHITQALMRLMAPVLSFTADEIWQTLAMDEEATVFEETWYDLPAHGLSEQQINDWALVLDWRAKAAKEIELVREAGKIGAALESKLIFNVTQPNAEALQQLGDDLRFVMLTSDVAVNVVAEEAQQTIEVMPLTHKKCERCWHYLDDVGANAEHPTLCSRCLSNLFGTGEKRQFA